MTLRARVRLLPFLLAAALVATIGAVPTPVRAVAPPPVAVERDTPSLDLLTRIERLGIVDKVREMRGVTGGGTRFFRIWFRLPVDHDHPNGRRFTLRATLLHRGTGRPMVMATGGYGLYTWNGPYRTEVTRIVSGNQLDLEHRFFQPSRPRKPDWDTQLTIRQSAADQHLIARALQRIYQRPWISTGASKGGMTMTYQRRFYPSDVAGTVAYVAPNDAVDDEDVYDDFQAEVGGPGYADCRERLVAVQRRILTDRAWFRDRLADWAHELDLHFRLVGSANRTLEVAVIETYFAFWQYQPAQSACHDVPAAAAGRRRVWDWVDQVLGWYSFTDEGTRPFVPYYFQAGTQLGAPAPYEDEIADLLRYPGHDVPATFVPDRLEPLTFDASAMADVDAWVRSSARRMLFVYGEFDPWSAEAFDCGPDGNDRQCYRRVVPAGNHGADVRSLPDATRQAAIARIRQWAGVSMSDAAIDAADRRARQTGVDPAREARTAVPAR